MMFDKELVKTLMSTTAGVVKAHIQSQLDPLATRIMLLEEANKRLERQLDSALNEIMLLRELERERR